MPSRAPDTEGALILNKNYHVVILLREGIQEAEELKGLYKRPGASSQCMSKEMRGREFLPAWYKEAKRHRPDVHITGTLQEVQANGYSKRP